MYWQENDESQNPAEVGEVVDIAFHIKCEAIPVDHGYALGQAILAALPWFRDEARTAVHNIHVADSGNGWMRPEDPDELIFPSRRTRLILRIPRNRLDDINALTGKVLDINGHRLEVGQPSTRELSPFSAVYARFLVAEDDDDEEEFLVDVARQLDALSIRHRKMMCGISKTILTPDDKLRTRSLMLADLAPEESLLLQQAGIGQHRYLGCGIFIPHKDIKSIGEPYADSAR
ncbi:MAG: type I-MYXAN CRISPR-associated protein Cas6/Cmx6 [Acidiferrobacterales bacterium]